VRSVVVASSDKAYGESDVLPYVEGMRLDGKHPYDVSKSCTDLLARTYHHTYGLPVGILRCGNIFGGGDLNWSRIVPGTIRSLFRGERPVIRSDGKYLRDYLYVRDASEAYRVLAAALHEGKSHGEAFNISPEHAYSVLEIVDCLKRLSGREDLEPVVLNQASGEIREQHLSCEKAAKQLGWTARYSLDQGMKETLAWYRDFLTRDPR
jgi:CDP-glucose 4,6-dehydratase